MHHRRPAERRMGKVRTKAWAMPKPTPSRDRVKDARQQEPVRTKEAPRAPVELALARTKRTLHHAWEDGIQGFYPCSLGWGANQEAAEGWAPPVGKMRTTQPDAPWRGRGAVWLPCAPGSAPPSEAWSGPRRALAVDGGGGSRSPAERNGRQDRPSAREGETDRPPPLQARVARRQSP